MVPILQKVPLYTRPTQTTNGHHVHSPANVLHVTTTFDVYIAKLYYIIIIFNTTENLLALSSFLHASEINLPPYSTND